MKNILILMLLVIFVGCSQKSEPQPPVVKEYQGQKRTNHMLGTLLGCSKHMEEYGFTKEECGELWDMKFDVEWGDVQ